MVVDKRRVIGKEISPFIKKILDKTLKWSPLTIWHYLSGHLQDWQTQAAAVSKSVPALLRDVKDILHQMNTVNTGVTMPTWGGRTFNPMKYDKVFSKALAANLQRIVDRLFMATNALDAFMDQMKATRKELVAERKFRKHSRKLDDDSSSDDSGSSSDSSDSDGSSSKPKSRAKNNRSKDGARGDSSRKHSPKSLGLLESDMEHFQAFCRKALSPDKRKGCFACAYLDQPKTGHQFLNCPKLDKALEKAKKNDFVAPSQRNAKRD